MPTWLWVVLAALAFIGAADVLTVIVLCLNAWLRGPKDSYPRMYEE